MSNNKVLLLGAAGYIGGAVLDALLRHPKVSELDITAYVRSPEIASKVTALGVNTVGGPASVVEDAVSKADIVINCANSDDVTFVETILVGAKRAYERTHVAPVIINTSGAAVLSDGSMGQPGDKVYDDLADESFLAALPDTPRHRKADILLAAAHKEGIVKAYNIIPSFVYGLATGRFVDAGIQNPVPTGFLLFDAIRQARGPQGSFGRVGPGKNISNTVEIHDLAQFYLVMLYAILEGKELAGGDAYYTQADGELTIEEWTQDIATAFQEFGGADNADVTEITAEEHKRWPFLAPLGDNIRITDSRSRSLGWKPEHTSKDVAAKTRECVRVYIANGLDKQNKLLQWFGPRV
ncbi:hypothetical protein EIP91_007817 [Steccherinum ochraceum]|uniref:NAD(P)-binding domain-containing protein n=1 Tax=Steccherinum ochraceum TaxID=92696 RepID=A0A4R0RDZ5_9APHY|nr:hypothetical protein EIP91_007817 [Steccherinum ochraceum]